MNFFPSKLCQIVGKLFSSGTKKYMGPYGLKSASKKLLKKKIFPTSTLPQCLACLTFFNFAKILDFDCNNRIIGTQLIKFQNFIV